MKPECFGLYDLIRRHIFLSSSIICFTHQQMSHDSPPRLYGTTRRRQEKERFIEADKQRRNVESEKEGNEGQTLRALERVNSVLLARHRRKVN